MLVSVEAMLSCLHKSTSGTLVDFVVQKKHNQFRNTGACLLADLLVWNKLNLQDKLQQKDKGSQGSEDTTCEQGPTAMAEPTVHLVAFLLYQGLRGDSTAEKDIVDFSVGRADRGCNCFPETDS